MRKNRIGLLFAIMGLVLVGCTTPTENIPANDTETAAGSQTLFDEEFDSLDGKTWSSQPSLTPFPDFEGSNIPGEVKVENGILMLSRYAPELSGENPVSSIQTINTVYLPATYSAAMRFKNEFVAFGFGKVFVEIYQDKIRVGYEGIQQDSFAYRSNNDNYFIMSLHVTGGGYTIVIKGDAPDSTEETFSKDLDLSDIAGDSHITIMGGSNTETFPYSEVDYIRISH